MSQAEFRFPFTGMFRWVTDYSQRARLWILPIALLGMHGVLSMNAANRLSPTWDEIIYPAAGVLQWRTRAIDCNPEHPFVSKLIYALPLLTLRPALPLYKDYEQGGDAHQFGYQFTFHNRIPAQVLIFWSRFPAVIFSMLTAMLLFVWIRSLWGMSGATVSLAAYCSTPILLSRASLALLEMPMYFFMLLALWFHDRWIRKSRTGHLYAAGVCMGLAFLCKLPSLPLLPALLILGWIGPSTPPSLSVWCKSALRLIVPAAAVIVGSYAPWRGSWSALQAVINNLFVFDTIFPYYWRGHTFAQAPVFLSVIAWGMKAPLLVLAMGIGGFWAWWKSGLRERSTFLHFSVLILCCFASLLFFRNAVTTIQLSPVYLGLAGLSAGLGVYVVSRHRVVKYGWRLLVAATVLEAVYVHPNYLAYFNGLAGGSGQGYHWLSDSDQDWGQALPELAKYLHAHEDPNVLLGYSGAADPRAYGIHFQDLISPALYVRETQGESIGASPKPVWVVLGTKVLQSEPRYTDWIQKNVTPQANVGSCFLVYDVTQRPEAYRWIGTLYANTRRPAWARWAFERAQALDPGNEYDQKALAALRGHA